MKEKSLSPNGHINHPFKEFISKSDCVLTVQAGVGLQYEFGPFTHNEA